MRGVQVPLLACHCRPASKTLFKWRFAGVPMNAGMGIRTSIPKKPYFFRGGGSPPLNPAMYNMHMFCVGNTRNIEDVDSLMSST